jgi:hypothetical protein
MATAPDGRRAYWDNTSWQWRDVETDAAISGSALPDHGNLPRTE